MQFNLFIGNHGKRDGIEDFIEIISKILNNRGHDVTVSCELTAKYPNIIIDEFTSLIVNKQIENLKNKHPDTKLIYVLTEFIESKFGVRSFNLYGGAFDVAQVAFINIYLRRKRKDFPSASIKDYLAAILMTPVLFMGLCHMFVCALVKKGCLSARKKRLHQIAYLHFRYLGLLRMIQYADELIFAHDAAKNYIESIFEKKTPIINGTLYPEIEKDAILDNLFEDKRLGFEVTGSVTNYRKYWMLSIDKAILFAGLKYHFGFCKMRAFSDKDETNDPVSAYSLHPPQTRKWKYSSPTRIYRALNHDHSLPVLTKYFGQHPIEDICFVYSGDECLLKLYDFYQDKQTCINFMMPKLDRYIQVSTKENDKIVQQLAKLN